MNANVRNGLIGVLILGLGVGIGIFAKPAKVVTKTEIKEVIKEVEVKKEQKNIVVYSKKVTSKDGTIVEETKTEDRSTASQEIKKETDRELKFSNTTTRDSGLSVHALALKDLGQVNSHIEYGVFIKKRIIGNVSVGAMATTNQQLGLSVGLDF